MELRAALAGDGVSEQGCTAGPSFAQVVTKGWEEAGEELSDNPSCSMGCEEEILHNPHCQHPEHETTSGHLCHRTWQGRAHTSSHTAPSIDLINHHN